jgi:hypothetical protein
MGSFNQGKKTFTTPFFFYIFPSIQGNAHEKVLRTHEKCKFKILLFLVVALASHRGGVYGPDNLGNRH